MDCQAKQIKYLCDMYLLLNIILILFIFFTFYFIYLFYNNEDIFRKNNNVNPFSSTSTVLFTRLKVHATFNLTWFSPSQSCIVRYSLKQDTAERGTTVNI